MTKTLWLFTIGMFSVGAVAAPLAPQTLQARINASGAKWSAGDTPISRLSPESRKHLFGAVLPEGFGEFFRPTHARHTHGLPSSIDWRNVNGTAFTSPILNQGNCGSCVAFATIGTLETQMNIARNTPYSPWEFSPQYLFDCGGGSCDQGWTPDAAVSSLQDQGVPDEACMPYMSGATGQDESCSAACSDADSRSLKIVGSSTPTSFFLDVDAVKTALQKGPLVTTMSVYSDFLLYKSGVYKHVTGDMEGGHGVSIVGYNDADQAFIVRNSWGDTWGENGYFRIAYDDDSGVGAQTWQLQVPDSDGYVTLGSLRDNAVLTGTMSLNPISTYSGTTGIDVTLTRADGHQVWWGSPGQLHSVSLDSTQYADGEYTIVATAHHGGTDSTSQAHRVYICNGKFTGSIQTNLTNGQTVTGQQEVTLTLASSPIPFTRVNFTVTSVATGEQWFRSTYNTVPSMQMLWRAQLLPDGQYDLTFEGVSGSFSAKSAPLRVTVQN